MAVGREGHVDRETGSTKQSTDINKIDLKHMHCLSRHWRILKISHFSDTSIHCAPGQALTSIFSFIPLSHTSEAIRPIPQGRRMKLRKSLVLPGTQYPRWPCQNLNPESLI